MIVGMSRWEPNARGRLERAALELYLDRGFEQTTVAEIAGRAGVTERTFFRHFTDKREVLFSGASDLQGLLVAAVTDAPAGATPLEAVTAALDAAAAMFEERREGSRRRQAVINANPELQERELSKLAGLASAMAEALRRRGVADLPASLVAEAAVAVFKIAFEHWIDPAARKDFSQLIRDSFDELRTVTSGR